MQQLEQAHDSSEACQQNIAEPRDHCEGIVSLTKDFDSAEFKQKGRVLQVPLPLVDTTLLVFYSCS